MKEACSHVGCLNCAVIHQARVEMAYPFDAEKLQEELRCRAHNNHVEVERVTDVWNRAHTHLCKLYTLTFARESDLPAFHEALREIEADVKRAREVNRLLGLLEAEQGA